MLAAGGALSLAGANAAGANPPGPYNCTGSNGFVPAGTYSSVTISGVCYMPAGNVNIQENLDVEPGALLDAVSPGDPAAHHVVPATVNVGGNVNVGTGAVLLFGCSPNISCADPAGVTYDQIDGNLNGNGALAVVVHSATINGNVSLVGGGDGISGGASCSAAPAPWSGDASLTGTPVYTDLEDAVVGGNLNISNLESCWLGTLRDQVSGNATFVGNSMGDPDAMEIGNNLIGGNMNCTTNHPAVQYGDGGAAPNMVGGSAGGQCGFGIVVPNPGPAAGEGPGVPTHITVSTASLGSYAGTHTVTSVLGSHDYGVTASGDTLTAQSEDIVLAGAGLTVKAGSPAASTNEKIAVTTYPNGSESFTAYDSCNCSFEGKSGVVSVRAYGTVSVSGVTRGNFLVTSGAGGLATLAGEGTFTSAGEGAGVLSLREHLDLS
jgi:hypothetical protein